MFVPLAFVAFWPTPVDQPIGGQLATFLDCVHRHGVPPWVDYTFIEAFANVLLFVPLGFAALLAFPKRAWWQIGAFGLLVSGCIELGQLLFLHDRFASPEDVMTNASGAVIGALLGVLATEKRRPTISRAVGLPMR